MKVSRCCYSTPTRSWLPARRKINRSCPACWQTHRLGYACTSQFLHGVWPELWMPAKVACGGVSEKSSTAKDIWQCDWQCFAGHSVAQPGNAEVLRIFQGIWCGKTHQVQAENKPRFFSSKLRQAKLMTKANPDTAPYQIVYGLLSNHATSNSVVKQQYINGHFCYGQKASFWPTARWSYTISLFSTMHSRSLILKFPLTSTRTPQTQTSNSAFTVHHSLSTSGFQRQTSSFAVHKFLGDATFDSYNIYVIMAAKGGGKDEENHGQYPMRAGQRQKEMMQGIPSIFWHKILAFTLSFDCALSVAFQLW